MSIEPETEEEIQQTTETIESFLDSKGIDLDETHIYAQLERDPKQDPNTRTEEEYLISYVVMPEGYDQENSKELKFRYQELQEAGKAYVHHHNRIKERLGQADLRMLDPDSIDEV